MLCSTMTDKPKQNALLKRIFGSMEGTPVITAPFYYGYGSNISIGKIFYTKHNIAIRDGAKITWFF